jgi:hypothetical protein
MKQVRSTRCQAGTCMACAAQAQNCSDIIEFSEILEFSVQCSDSAAQAVVAASGLHADGLARLQKMVTPAALQSNAHAQACWALHCSHLKLATQP